MDQRAHGRYIESNHFGDGAILVQGDFNSHAATPQRSRLAKVNVIPYPRNEDVVRRPDLMDRLDALLPLSTEFNSAALWGLGGSGKTQIALDYAYRRSNDPDVSVFWVHADSETTFTQDYTIIALKLGVSEALKGDQMLSAVRYGIEAEKAWLLVVDNADDLGIFDAAGSTKKGLESFIPRGSGGAVLWTSRDEHIVGTLVGARRGIKVGLMSRDEAGQLLATMLDEGTDGDCPDESHSQLLEELQYLPLAISQAGAYMNHSKTSVEEHLAMLREGKSRWDVLREFQADRHRPQGVSNSVLETWRISIEHIRGENTIAYKILNMLAFVDNKNVPFELLTCAGNEASSRLNESDKTTDPASNGKAIDKWPAGTMSGGRDFHRKIRIKQAIARLREFSFISEIQSGGKPHQQFEMHKLLQEALRYRLLVQIPTTPGPRQSQDNEAEGCEVYFQHMALRILSSLIRSEQTGPPDRWPSPGKYVAHVMRATEWTGVSGQQVEAADLLDVASGALGWQGRWRQKQEVDQRALDLRSSALGLRHPATLVSMTQLAKTYTAQGQYEESQKLNQQALDTRLSVLGEEDPDTIDSLAWLGTSYYGQRRFAEAEGLQIRALRLCRATHGDKHHKTLRRMGELAVTQHANGRPDEALATAAQTFELMRTTLGPDHFTTLTYMSSLGGLYYEAKLYDKAEAIQVALVEQSDAIYGPRHPMVLQQLTRLGRTYYHQGRVEDSETLMNDVVRTSRAVNGPGHPDTAKYTEDLALFYRETGRTEEAQALEDVAKTCMLAGGAQQPSQSSSSSGPTHRKGKSKEKPAPGRALPGRKFPNIFPVVSGPLVFPQGSAFRQRADGKVELVRAQEHAGS